MGNRGPRLSRPEGHPPRARKVINNGPELDENNGPESPQRIEDWTQGEVVASSRGSEQAADEKHFPEARPKNSTLTEADTHNDRGEQQLQESQTDKLDGETKKADPNHAQGFIYNSTSRMDSVSSSRYRAISPTLDGSAREVTFNIVLHCIPDKTTRKKTVTFVRCPQTVLELKQSIQTELSIPACCQNIFFDTVLLADTETLCDHRIQDGDRIDVHYTSEANVVEILDIVKSMRKTVLFLESIQLELSHHNFTQGLERRIILSVKEPSLKVESLAIAYFYPSSSERANANRYLFVSSGGLDLLYQMHVSLLKQPWERTHVEMQYLEHAILRVLWNITASFSVRNLVLRNPTLEPLVSSMLRVKVRRGRFICSPYKWNARAYGGQAAMDHIICEVIYKAVGTICK